MRRVWLNRFLWTVFAASICIGAAVMLKACDFGFRSLFAGNACLAPEHNASLDAERAMEAHLRSRIHAEEIRLALLPSCPKPLPPPPPPVKAPEPPTVIPPPLQAFEVPKKVEDLKGCWQSARGDIVTFSDDAAHRPVAKARLCYCFKADGQGMAQIQYSDGEACRARLTARILSDRVFMRQDKISCPINGDFVVHDITCRDDKSGKALCEIVSRGQTDIRRSEQFIRVTDEYCNWNG